MCRTVLFALSALAISAAPSFSACLAKAPDRFVANGEIVTDAVSGLVWSRCATGMTWNAGAGDCSGEPEGLSQQAAQDAAASAGNGWRVPTGEELETLLIDTCEGLKIDSRAFPGIGKSDFGEGAKFWTSTEAMPGMFYFFDFANGYADMHSAGYSLSVLLVRGSHSKSKGATP